MVPLGKDLRRHAMNLRVGVGRGPRRGGTKCTQDIKGEGLKLKMDYVGGEADKEMCGRFWLGL